MAKSNPKPQGKQRRIRTERTGNTLVNFNRRQGRRVARLLRAAERRASNTHGLTKAGRPRRATHAQTERREESARRINAKRATRERKRNYRKARPKDRHPAGSPTERGEIQFGNMAKGHHTHQRINRLARALTPTEFKAIQARENQALTKAQ